MKADKLVISQIALATRQNRIIKAETPREFVKERAGKGGKKFTYVETGYVIARLNEAFSPLGWEFKITERGETQRKNENSTEGEVWVYGELTIIDHKQGFRVTKGQYGQHNVYEKVPMGDAYKAAASDALKKCASLMGIALDIYWSASDEVEVVDARVKQEKKVKKEQQSKEQMFESAVKMIKATTDIQTLQAWKKKVEESKIYDKGSKEALTLAINNRIEVLGAGDNEKDTKKERK